MENKQKYLMWGLCILGVLVLFFSINYFVQRSQMNTIVTQMTTDKENLESDYQNVLMGLDSLTTDNKRISLNNDSLFYQLESQQHKISQLMDELKMVKATNMTKINQYRKELSTMREVLKSYVKQIDELNTENAALKKENSTYKQKQVIATTQITALAQEKKKLETVVNIASTLVVNDLVVETLNSHDKKTRRLSHIVKVKISFTIAKNVTASPGSKTVYLRILKPNGDVANVEPGNVLDFENSKIDFTSKTDIEYGGEDLPAYIVWNVNELIFAGTYQAFLIIDGKQVGTTNFTIK